MRITSDGKLVELLLCLRSILISLRHRVDYYKQVRIAISSLSLQYIDQHEETVCMRDHRPLRFEFQRSTKERGKLFLLYVVTLSQFISQWTLTFVSWTPRMKSMRTFLMLYGSQS